MGEPAGRLDRDGGHYEVLLSNGTRFVKEGHCDPRRMKVGLQWPLFPLCCSQVCWLQLQHVHPLHGLTQTFFGHAGKFSLRKFLQHKSCVLCNQTRIEYILCALISTVCPFQHVAEVQIQLYSTNWLNHSVIMSQLVLLNLWIKREPELDPVILPQCLKKKTPNYLFITPLLLRWDVGEFLWHPSLPWCKIASISYAAECCWDSLSANDTFWSVSYVCFIHEVKSGGCSQALQLLNHSLHSCSCDLNLTSFLPWRAFSFLFFLFVLILQR